MRNDLRADEFNRLIDECIDRINSGDSIESCISDHLTYSEQLKPLLLAMLQAKNAYSFIPREEVRTKASHRFNVAMAKRLRESNEPRPWLVDVLGKPLAWAALALAAAAIVGIYFGINQTLYPVSPFMPQPSTQGNFALLISDDVNAIADFESVVVYISRVGLFSGYNGGWIEFEPDINEVDLTTLKGDKTQQIWRGDLPEGEYSKIFIYVATVKGVLQGAEGQLTEIKLPGNKLHISKTFEIMTDGVTTFTYDLTVLATGNEKSGIRYILKPQADESGVDVNSIQ